MTITIVSGTNRPGSRTLHVARHIRGIYSDMGRPTRLIDLAEVPENAWSPQFYGDNDSDKPRAFQPYVQAMREASALVVVTPEYNGGIPGVLKLFIDMLPGRDYNLVGRSVCFVGIAAGDWGGLRPVEQLESIFLYRKAFLFPERVLVRNCEDAIGPGGELLDPAVEHRLRNQVHRFLRFADQLRPLQALFNKAGNPAGLEHPETVGT